MNKKPLICFIQKHFHDPRELNETDVHIVWVYVYEISSISLIFRFAELPLRGNFFFVINS